VARGALQQRFPSGRGTRLPSEASQAKPVEHRDSLVQPALA
jgi:hypothetical protein